MELTKGCYFGSGMMANALAAGKRACGEGQGYAQSTVTPEMNMGLLLAGLLQKIIAAVQIQPVQVRLAARHRRNHAGLEHLSKRLSLFDRLEGVNLGEHLSSFR